MSLPKPFTSGFPPEWERDWELLSAHIDKLAGRQIMRGAEPEMLEQHIIQGPGEVWFNGIMAEQSQLKEDFRQLSSTLRLVYGNQVTMGKYIKKLTKENELLRKRLDGRNASKG